MDWGRRVGLVLTVAVKAALLGVLLLVEPRPDGPAVDANVMTGRVLAYPFVVALVPAAWLLARRLLARRPAYPYAVDVLITIPFLGDTVGAVAGAYDAFWWYDDLGHFGGWAILVAAFMLLLRRAQVTGWVAAGLGIGFGATTAILWELAEYLTFLRHTEQPMVTYVDTLGDMALGLAGSTLAAVLFAFVFTGRSEPAERRERAPAAPARAARSA